ncbi:TonB-dependent receptor domain-containing protein [Lysobacter enzymogenes]|uniref:TonB-dependent receptor domain-containing protein n=1 Tax=Lysobacter enzymogenes TaxID=69 RepID=UPI000F4D1596|nr:TonB-dependent receptor [Lysobacter enzymogenes]
MNRPHQYRVRKSLLRLTALTAGIGIGLAGQAQAQTAPAAAESAASSQAEAKTLDRVAVTGSKIKGVDMESAVPLTSVTRAEIERMGVTSVDEVMRVLTVSGEGAGRMSNDSHNSFANLRNIGSNRTLVLVNGHRWVGSSNINGTVNLNSIPLAAVERVDVLKDGGSVLYGADAMVGLINIILKDDFDGAEGSVRFSTYGKGGIERNVNLTGGHAGERFSAMLGVQFAEGEAIGNDEYEITSTPPPFGSPKSLTWSDATPAGRFLLCRRGAALVNGLCPTNRQEDPSGRGGAFFTYDEGKTGTTDWHTYNRSNDGFNDRGYRDLLTGYKRKSAVGSMKFDISDHMQFKVFAQYMDESMKRPLPPTTIDVGSSALPFVIPTNSYYNPFGKPIARVQRALAETGGRGFASRAQTKVISSSLTGDFELAGRSFDWEVGFMTGITSQHADNLYEVSASRVRNALGPSFKDASGKIVCGTPGKVIEGCVPLNLLGTGAVTQEMLNYLRIDSNTNSNYFRDNDYFAQISTPNLFSLPAGDVGMAAGVERHVVWGRFVSSEVLQRADVLGSSSRQPASGGYGVKEAYAEFYVPVLKDLPLVKQLDFSLAGRFSKYDSGVSAFNKKWGMKWKITDDLALRASYSTGYRLDLGGLLQNDIVGVLNLTGSTFDPCTVTRNSSGTVIADHYGQLTPDLQAKCRAYGVPEGGYDSSLATNVATQRNANQELQPEKDVFRTLGLLYSPHFIDGLDLGLDYWDVRFRDSIVFPTPQTMLDNCLAFEGDSHRCPDGWVERDAKGVVTYVRNAALNSLGQGERYTGYDFNAKYRLKTKWGNFRADWTNTYLSLFQLNAVPPFQSMVGTYTANTFPTRPNFRLRSNLALGWDLGNWGVQWTARYYSSLKEQCRFVGTIAVDMCNDLGEPTFVDPNGNVANNRYLPFLRGGSANRLGAYTLHDISVSYKAPWLDGARISGGVRNAFNKQPSVSMTTGLSSSGIGFSPGFGMPDRYYYVEYKQKF